jgi:hypothetical protein
MRKMVLMGLSAAFLAGCQSTAPAPSSPRLAFDPAAAAFIKKEGKATIKGHAFLRRGTGGVVNAAGEYVRLVPMTPFSQERFARLYGGKKFISQISIPAADADAEYASYTRTTKAESSGRFEFDKVAPGSYFVTTQVTWKKESAFLPNGGAFYETVTITGKEEDPVTVLVTGN